VIVNVFSVILLYFMFLHFILYCGQLYPALLSSSYFERINDDDDDDSQYANANASRHCP